MVDIKEIDDKLQSISSREDRVIALESTQLKVMQSAIAVETALKQVSQKYNSLVMVHNKVQMKLEECVKKYNENNEDLQELEEYHQQMEALHKQKIVVSKEKDVLQLSKQASYLSVQKKREIQLKEQSLHQKEMMLKETERTLTVNHAQYDTNRKRRKGYLIDLDQTYASSFAEDNQVSSFRWCSSITVITLAIACNCGNKERNPRYSKCSFGTITS